MCNWDSEIILTLRIFVRGAVKILFIISAINRGRERNNASSIIYFAEVLYYKLLNIEYTIK